MAEVSPKLLPKRLKVFVENFSYLSISFVLTYLFGYVFHSVLTRKIGPVSYGEFSAIYALLIALSRPCNLLTSAVARIGANTDSESGHLSVLNFSKGLAMVSCVGIGLVPISLYPVLKVWLKVQRFELYALAAATLMLWAWLNVLKGILVAREDFLTISLSGILETLSRALLGIVLVLAGAGVVGALSSSPLGAMFGLYLVAKRVGPFPPRSHEGLKGSKTKDFLSTTIKVMAISVPVGFLVEMDVMLAKRFFEPDFAGIYASSALIGKGILMFTGIFSTLIYPRLVRSRLSWGGLKAFFYSVAFVLITFVSGFALCYLFSEKIVLLFFGKQFVVASSILPRYIIAILPLAIHFQLLNYIVAIGGVIEAGFVWFELLVYYICLEFFSSSLNSYLYSIFLCHLIFLFMGCLLLYIRHHMDTPKM